MMALVSAVRMSRISVRPAAAVMPPIMVACFAIPIAVFSVVSTALAVFVSIPALVAITAFVIFVAIATPLSIAAFVATFEGCPAARAVTAIAIGINSIGRRGQAANQTRRHDAVQHRRTPE